MVGSGGTAPPGEEPAFIADPRFNFHTVGYTPGRGRGYTEYVLMQEWQPIAVPGQVRDEEAALCEPCGVAVRAVRNSALRLGDSVAVLGAGPIGMFTIQAARAAGATAVFVSEPSVARKAAAAKLGADAVVDPIEEDVVARMESLTGGKGPDVVFDCAGTGSTLDQAFNMVRRSGQVVLVAVSWQPVPVLPVNWMGREVRLQSSFGAWPNDYRIALDLIGSGRVTIEPMVSQAEFIPLAEIQAAFEALAQPSTQLQTIIAL